MRYLILRIESEDNRSIHWYSTKDEALKEFLEHWKGIENSHTQYLYEVQNDGTCVYDYKEIAIFRKGSDIEHPITRACEMVMRELRQWK